MRGLNRWHGRFNEVREAIRDLYRAGAGYRQITAVLQVGQGTIAKAIDGLPTHTRATLTTASAARLVLLKGVQPVDRWRFTYFPPSKDRHIRRWRCWGCSRVNQTGKCPCGNVPQWAA